MGVDEARGIQTLSGRVSLFPLALDAFNSERNCPNREAHALPISRVKFRGNYCGGLPTAASPFGTMWPFHRGLQWQLGGKEPAGCPEAGTAPGAQGYQGDLQGGGLLPSSPKSAGAHTQLWRSDLEGD